MGKFNIESLMCKHPYSTDTISFEEFHRRRNFVLKTLYKEHHNHVVYFKERFIITLFSFALSHDNLYIIVFINLCERPLVI